MKVLPFIPVNGFKLFNIFIMSMKGDVYPVEPYDDFSKNKVLDAHWGVLYDNDVSFQLTL